MQFACVVWATKFLNNNFLIEHPIIRPILVLYRKLIKLLLNLGDRTPTIPLYIVSNKMPLQLTIGKLVWRYFKRISEFGRDTTSTE
jgi:hypothetical protein